MSYHRIGFGPELAYSQAECEIASGSVERGVVAFGSPGYVAGAQLGNAIGNAIRKQEFIKNCMIMHGWQLQPDVHAQAVDPKGADRVPPQKGLGTPKPPPAIQ